MFIEVLKKASLSLYRNCRSRHIRVAVRGNPIVSGVYNRIIDTIELLTYTIYCADEVRDLGRPVQYYDRSLAYMDVPDHLF